MKLEGLTYTDSLLCSIDAYSLDRDTVTDLNGTFCGFAGSRLYGDSSNAVSLCDKITVLVNCDYI